MELKGDSFTIRPDRRGSHAEAIRRTIRHMESHLDSKVDLDELAGVACMSPCHYLRVFRRLTGIPPARFLGILRLQLAKDLLIGTERAVFDIALDVGYTSLGTFTSRFAQLVGMSPARFREIHLAMLSGVVTPPHMPTLAARAVYGPTFHGRIDHDAGDVTLFAGLFTSPIPQEEALVCDMLVDRTHFSLAVPQSEGPFHLLAVALKQVPPGEAFDNRALIAGVCACGPLRASDTSIPLELRLRPIDLLDPPILLAFPMLMHLRSSIGHATPMEAGVPRILTQLSAMESTPP